MKIQLFKKAEGEDWEAIDDQYRCLAVPVLRLPQADWGVQENHTQQWIYCLPSSGCDIESLPEWIRCHWDAQAGRWVVVSSEAAGVKHFVTPVGGIAARSGATLGSATCTMLTIAGGTRATTAATATVYNNFTSAVGGSVDIVAAKIDGVWSVIAEDCA